MTNPVDRPGFPLATDVRPDIAPRKSSVGKIVLGIVVALVVAVGVYALSSMLFGGNDASDAKAGDCISSDEAVKDQGTTETGADVVDCGSSDAKFTVVARVDGEGSTESKACDKFFQPEEVFYVFANSAGDGYVLCLRPKA
ncbi:hypothetical protein OWR29_33750 [Actinoplanes sp. Pm04-4]|uniref:Uncharacterized protein n=1 Tax=Paractinoplanes pyxinae TaxID=2997416 RepID=A0ABT4B910_9ACTN|nr:hypothetical protein [Actinoplanes pyxinae]MCY1142985.1 hypothetical protein [Actinoplanes pyxinae]